MKRAQAKPSFDYMQFCCIAYMQFVYYSFICISYLIDLHFVLKFQFSFVISHIQFIKEMCSLFCLKNNKRTPFHLSFVLKSHFVKKIQRKSYFVKLVS